MAARSPNRTTKTAGNRAPASRRTSAKAAPGGSRASSSRSTSQRAAESRSVPRKRSAKSSGHISVGLLAWIVCGVLVAAAWWIYPVMRLHYNEQRKLASIQAQYASVTQRNQTLKQQVEHLKTRAGVEDEARKSLGMVGQGENVYVVLDKDEGVAVASTGSSTSPVSAAAADDPVTQLLDGIFGFVP